MPRLCEAPRISRLWNTPHMTNEAAARKEAPTFYDHFEHLLDSAPLVSDLLSRCPSVHVLVTSREPLNVLGECAYDVAGLPIPLTDGFEALELSAAAQLFVQSGRRAQHGFALTPDNARDIYQICRAVDGMPLALELAAAWLRGLTCKEIADSVATDLDLLASDARNLPERHRSLRAVFNSSWDRLSKQELGVFMCLAVFHGEFTLEAAKAVTGVDIRLMLSLVNRSLVRRDPASGRFRLHELLRQYAEEHLRRSSEQERAARHAHIDYYSRFVEQQWESMPSGRGLRRILDAIEANMDNVRAAWWGAVSQGDTGALLRMERGLALLYDLRNWLREAAQLFGQTAVALAARSPDPEAQVLRGLMLARQAWFLVGLRQLEQSRATAETGLAIIRRFDAPRELMLALNCYTLPLAFLEEDVLCHGAAQQALELAARLGDLHSQAWACYVLGGRALYWQGNITEARRLGEQALELAEAAGDDWMTACSTGLLLAQANLNARAFDDAHQFALRGLATFEEIGQLWGVMVCTMKLGKILKEQGRYAEAWPYYFQSAELSMQIASYEGVMSLIDVADLLLAEGNRVKAVELLTFVVRHPETDVTHKRWVDQRLVELRTQVPEEAFQAARSRGELLDLDTVMADLRQRAAAIPVAHVGRPAPVTSQYLVEPLSSRELEVLTLMAEGLSNAEIADYLVVSLSTVKKHINHMFAKLGANSRTRALVLARELELL